MAIETNPSVLHSLGLEATLDGRFSDAESLYAEAREGYFELGLRSDGARLERDFARTFAGLGEVALRDEAIDMALDIHQEIFYGSDDNVAPDAAQNLQPLFM